ncbi:hypothetical protein DSO57_1015128 [Entomophthora muscae]|uniref:Uncharacterized protein n=1 Tax=Entomophthora muscae TaxID=34485 RepID=A0ACC2TGF9_9FUNG|nr:hypothetical protein DSO57_1015128 [Entomophthora muscae]
MYGMDCTKEQVEAKQCYGGLARLKTAIDKLRQQQRTNLLLDAGDQFQGTLFYGYYRGNVTWEAMNLLKYDAMTIGNHEFDNGSDNLARVAKQFQFPLVCSNIVATRHPLLKDIVKNYVLFPEKKIALVGYITPNVPSIADVGPLLDVLDPKAAVQKAIDQVHALGYTRVIAVSHNGYEEDVELASKLRGLSLIVGGHSHSYLAPKEGAAKNAPPSQGLYPTPVKDQAGKTVYVVQAYCWSRFLGHLDIKFGKDGYLTSITGTPIDLDASVIKDAAVDSLVKKWRFPFDAYSKKELGVAKGEFDRQSCYNRECSLGDFLADVMLEYRPKADVAILNSGDIRYAIKKGKVTVGNVQNALPYGSTIVTIDLTGKQICDLVEGVLSRTSVSNNHPVTSFIQVSHLLIQYKANNPNFKKITSIQVQDRASLKFSSISQSKVYSVVTTDFIAKGGDNLLFPPHPNYTLLEALDQVTMDHISKHSPVSPPEINRIINLS